MAMEFIANVQQLYILLLTESTLIEKITEINNFKRAFGIKPEENLSDYYGKLNDNIKEKGIVYTPKNIAEYMIRNTIKAEDIIRNPYMKIMDPSCGCGNIVIECYNYLLSLFTSNIEHIKLKNNLKLKRTEISRHIIDNNLFGTDIDSTAICVLQIDLFCLSNYINPDNFFSGDFLFENCFEKYNIIIGNPPYVGHKSMNSSYSNEIRQKFSDILKDKGDLAYCFLSKAINDIPKGGRVTFITSRYFLESPSGATVRKVLMENISIKQIVDYYGIRPFKGIGIDPVILFLGKEKSDDIEVIRPKKYVSNLSLELLEGDNCRRSEHFKIFHMNKSELNEKNWMLIDRNGREIIRKIERKCSKSLSDLCNSYQGIITGCDKAFIVGQQIIKEYNIENNLLKPWIKSSHIKKNSCIKGEEYIIYANLIEDEKHYPNSINYIGNQKEKLLNRRECKKGSRKWFELQWGRDKEVFDGKKIIFPYKSSDSRFALDTGSYFSADIYAITIKNISEVSYEYLTFILNSSLYEFYFKSYGKKLGGELYDYYPNNVMKLRIPDMPECKFWCEEYFYDYFELSKEEINIINQKGNLD